MTPLITLNNITVRLGNKTVLADINLTLNPQDVISVIGPNGGGKSTLLKALLGQLPLAKGSIQRQSDLGIGYVPQNFHLSDSVPLRVCDFLALCGQSSRVHSSHSQLVYEQYRITPLLLSPMQQLSGGERQRVLLAHALLSKPQLVVLDEPMQGLDPETQAELYALIRQLPEHYGCAVLIVSHDLHWVMQGTQHVVCINQHICCEGQPMDIQSETAFQELYQSNNYLNTLPFQQQEHIMQSFYSHDHQCEHDCDDTSTHADHKKAPSI